MNEMTLFSEEQARLNALDILLRYSMPDAVEHLEALVSAIITTMNPQTKNKFNAVLEELEPAELTVDGIGEGIVDITDREVVKLQGENGNDAKSKRQLWSAERKALKAKLAELEKIEHERMMNSFNEGAAASIVGCTES